MNLDSITREEKSAFRLRQMPTQTYELDKATQLDIVIERDLDLTIINRYVQNLPDLLASVAGVALFLYFFLRFLLSLWNCNYMERYMVS